MKSTKHITKIGRKERFIALHETNKESSSCRLNATVLKTANRKGKKKVMAETLGVIQPILHRYKYIFFTHTCCLPVKRLHCTAGSPPSLPAHHTPCYSSLFTTAGPLLWSVRCQLQTCCTTALESLELTVTYFFPVLLIGRGSAKHRNTVRKKRYDQSCQPVVELIRTYTYWEPCNISIASDAATVH